MKVMHVSSDLWEITHEQVITDSMGYATTVVQANSKEEAMKFFNEDIADGIWTLPISDLNNVRIFSFYKKG